MIRAEAGLRAVAQARRREILRLIWDSELAAGAIADHFAEVTRPAVSQHLRVLRDAGLVAERRSGTRRMYRARPERIAEVLAQLDAFWGERLGALKSAAEREHRGRS